MNPIKDKHSITRNSDYTHLLALYNYSTMGMVICSVEGKYMNVNDQFTLITGYSKEELYKLTFHDITHPDDLATELEIFEELLAGKAKNIQLEKRYVTKDKQIVWVNVMLSIVLNSENQAEVIVGTIENITEKKQMLLELEKSKLEYKKALKLSKSIQDAIPDPIGVQDPKKNIILYNKAGYALVGKTHEEVFGKKCYELIGKKKPCTICSTSEAKKTKKLARHEQYFPEYDTWLDMRAYPIFDENNEIIYFVEHLRDITNEKKLELKLKETIKKLTEAKLQAEESDNLKTAFLHNISHEIRTPLNGIIGFSNLLKESGLNSSKISRYTNIIIESGWKLSDIIDDLLAIAIIETGQEKARYDKTDINKLVQNIYNNFQLKAQEKGILLHSKVDSLSQLKYISTDETKLFEIISNLINNAIKFTHKGYVEIGASVLKDELQFYVKDTGIGIRKENLKKIFNRFAQANSKNSSHTDGSGLGLSISEAYVNLLGGKIWLDSQPNVGTTFYFTIPLIVEKDSEKNKTILNIQHTNKITILLAEDDETNYLYFSEIVKDLNINLLHAENGSEAVGICKQEQKIDLIFMDIKMPVMNGHEATKEIKSIKPEIPIIALSAYFEDKEKVISEQMGCVNYISKPFKKDDIVAEIQKVKI